MGTPLRVLIVEDSEDDLNLLLRELRRSGYDVTFERVETAEAMNAALDSQQWDVILSDFSMPAFNAPAALKLTQARGVDIPFIIVSGTIGEEAAVAAMKAGAHDFFSKQKLTLLVPAIERELREAEERRKHRLSERALHQSEERFARVFQASPVGISITGSNGLFVDANERFLQIVGFSRDELIGHSSLELELWADSADRARSAQSWGDAHTFQDLEIRFRTRSGEVRDGLCSFARVEVDDQMCILSMIHDITERKQMQQALQVSEEKFRLLMDLAPEAIILTDKYGTISLTNTQTEKVFGYTRNELIGRSIETLMPDRFRRSHPTQRADFMASPSTRLMGVGRELWGLRKDGHEFPVEVGLSAINAPDGVMVASFVADITARRESEEQHRYHTLLLANVSDAVMSTDMDFRIRTWNRGAELVYGWKAEEVVDQTTLDLLHTEFPEGSAAETLHQLDTHGVWEGEVIQRRKDGTPVQIMSAVSYVTDSDEKRIAIVAVNRDITERKRAEEALREAKQRLQFLVSATPAVIYSARVSEDFGTNFISENIVQQVGYTPQEFTDNSDFWVSHIHPQDVERALAGMGQLLKQGHQVQEYRFRYPDGSYHWMRDESRVIYDPHGNPFEAVGYWIDITERKQAEEALRESEERHRNIAELISDYAFSYRVEPDHTIVPEWITGESLTRITGFTVEEIVARGQYTLYHPEDVETVKQHLDDVFRGQSVRSEYRILTKSGELRWLGVYRQPVWDEGQKRVVRYYGVAQDITEQKRIQQEILEAERLRIELEKDKELLQLKERFISVVSHEFRTPLSVILSSAELVHNYYDRMTRERQLEHLHEVLTQVGFMQQLLEDVLTINKARAGRIEFHPVPLDLKAFSQGILERTQTLDQGKHRFSIQIADDLTNVVLDAKLLQHILVNLVSNAVKYSPQGGEVRFEVSRHASEIVFRISDQGIGIPLEEQPRLFEPFHRAENVGEIGGTGLGLAIVKESVDLHRGIISCESQVGVGTTFTVRLPVA